MATASVRKVSITFTGDVSDVETIKALQNPSSPGQSEYIDLSSGHNTIAAPVGGTTPTGVTIVPPPTNTVALTLKGAGSDSGIPIHPTDPTSLGIAVGVSAIVIDAASTVVGVRVVWS